MTPDVANRISAHRLTTFIRIWYVHKNGDLKTVKKKNIVYFFDVELLFPIAEYLFERYFLFSDLAKYFLRFALLTFNSR